MSLFSENGGEKMKITEQHFNSAVVKDQQRNPRCDIGIFDL